MRTYDERISELHLRMDQRKHSKAVRRARLLSAAAYAVCGTIAALFALVISGYPVQVPDGSVGGVSASIFADHAMLGYIVVALLAFVLGALVTILCFWLRARANGEKNDD